jgi:hypothetical protein
MARVVSPPYRRPAAGRIEADAWMIATGGDLSTQPDRLEHWDYFTQVRVSRKLKVDVAALLADCALSADARLGAVIQWQCSWTGLRGSSRVIDIGGPRVEVDLVLEGERLGGSLRLDSRVILTHPGSSEAPLAPQRSGSVLWSDGVTVTLEGETARFPIQVVDFERAGIPGGTEGAWFLQWSPPDLEAPTLGSLRLLVNRANPLVARLVAEGPVVPELALLQSVLRHDIARQLIQGALDNPEFDRSADYGADALGTALQGLIDSTFGADSLESLRGLRRTSPQDFEVRLQAASRILSDGVGR